jgi:hypothetical protein
VSSGGDTGCGGSVSGSNDLLGIEEVDTEETDGVEGDEDECKHDSNVGGNEVILGDLRTTDSEAELLVSAILSTSMECTYHTSTHTGSGDHQELSSSSSFNEEEGDSTTDQLESQVGSSKDLG